MGLASRVVTRLPDRYLVAALTAVYSRFEPELRRLPELCPRGGTALDVGAWYGPWSARMARRADRVVAFEATPRIADILRRAAPSNVEVVAAAASDEAGEADIWVPDAAGPNGVNSLVRNATHSRAMRVPTVTVDSLGLEDVRFAKIDVEGHELPVLRGAEKTVRRWQPALFIEVESRMQPVSSIVDLLGSWGYRGWVLPGRAWLPLDRFDLVAHQRRTEHVAGRGLTKRVLWPWPRYVNSVLFLAGGARPGTA
ncbi:MAG TPA: FkbM family methyltransferase [Rugosimonospora sp.]|nr:FkbM family methyltransferase [Rugosimonospora sp.]